MSPLRIKLDYLTNEKEFYVECGYILVANKLLKDYLEESKLHKCEPERFAEYWLEFNSTFSELDKDKVIHWFLFLLSKVRKECP